MTSSNDINNFHQTQHRSYPYLEDTSGVVTIGS